MDPNLNTISTHAPSADWFWTQFSVCSAIRTRIKSCCAPCWLLRLALLMLACATVHAQDVSLLYSTSELQQIGARYQPNLRGMWEKDFLSRLTRDERARAGNVTLNLPLLGPLRYPLEFYSDPALRQVFLPLASVKFMDDIAVAFAYYGKIGCDLDRVSDYAAVLRFQPQVATGSPLDALGVPRATLNDPSVDDTAQKILKSTVFFVAAHEYAHVMYGHRKYTEISAQEAQQQEVESDAFALEIMRRIGVVPTGLTFFFMIAARLEATPADFSSEAEYETYLRQRATHPVSAMRILKIAEVLENQTDAFARLQKNPALSKKVLQDEVPKLRAIARGLDDPKMRVFLAERAKSADVSVFRRGCRQ
jgi:hypothetical protein